VALPTIGADQLNATRTTAAAAAGAIISQRIHSQGQRVNIWITPPRHTSASKTGTTATFMATTSQWAHQQDLHQTGSRSKFEQDKDQHDERVTGGCPQDNFTFSLRPLAPRPMPATCSRPSKLAATSAPRQLHQECYGADDAPCTLPPNALHGATMWAYPFSCCSACTSYTRTYDGHSYGALLCTIPSASSFLTIRGKQ
jgi:hypothetical protein